MPEQREDVQPRIGVPLGKPEKPKCEIVDGLAVLLSAEATQDLSGYSYATDNEISCLGTVIRQNNIFRIEHLYLLKQTGSFGHTEMDQTSVAEMMEQLISEGKTEEAKSLKCWVHSHPGGMGVFWSQTDNETCRRLVSDYLVSIVVGEGYRAKCRIDVAAPIAFAADDIPLFYEMPAESTKDYKALFLADWPSRSTSTPKGGFLCRSLRYHMTPGSRFLSRTHGTSKERNSRSLQETFCRRTISCCNSSTRICWVFTPEPFGHLRIVWLPSGISGKKRAGMMMKSQTGTLRPWRSDTTA